MTVGLGELMELLLPSPALAPNVTNVRLEAELKVEGCWSREALQLGISAIHIVNADRCQSS